MKGREISEDLAKTMHNLFMNGCGKVWNNMGKTTRILLRNGCEKVLSGFGIDHRRPTEDRIMQNSQIMQIIIWTENKLAVFDESSEDHSTLS